MKIIKTTCKSCHGGCGTLVTVENNKVVHIEGNPDSLTRGTMCAKGLAGIQDVHNPNRLLHPLKRKGERGEGKWEKISWDEALDTIAGRMKQNTENHGAPSILICQGTGRGYNRYTMRFARSIGTPNLGFPAHFCFAPKMAAFGITVGGRLFCDYHGWGGAFPKTQISWGKQLEITNADGEMGVWFLDSLEKCKNLILIDPRATRIAGRANLWLRIRPGTDAALALGMLNVIINEELYDKKFVENWTSGFNQLKKRVQEYPPQEVSELTWIPKEKIIEAARLFATDTPGCIQMGESLEAGNNSTQTLRAIICLMAVTGNIERPGSMVNWVPPATGSMEEFPLEIPAAKEAAIGADKFRLLSSPPFAMCHLPTVFRQLSNGDCLIRQMHIEGSNPLVAYANSRQVKKGLLNLEFLSVADLYMSPTAEYADIVLPAAHWLEMDDIYDMHPRFVVQAINKTVDSAGQAWPDNKIYNELGKRLAPDSWFESVEAMLDHQLRKADISFREFSKKGMIERMNEDQPYFKYKTDFWKKGGGFPTPTGKVELYSTIMEDLGYDPLPFFKEPNESPYSTPDVAEEYPYILSTGGRQPNYFHSQYRQVPLLRAFQPYPIVQIHSDTAKKQGIKEDEWVFIKTPRGKIKQKAKFFDGMDPRLVVVQASWWFPEEPGPDHGVWKSNANILTSNAPPYDPAMGSTSLRAMLCNIFPVEEQN